MSLLLLALGACTCQREASEPAAPAETPAQTATVAPQPSTEPAEASPPGDGWPLWAVAPIPDARASLDPGARVLDVEVKLDGSGALALVASGAEVKLLSWDFRSPPQPLAITGLEGAPTELALSPFDGAVYLLASAPRGGRLARGTLGPDGVRVDATLWTSDAPLSGLIAPYTRYNALERVMLTVGGSGGAQIVSIRRDGTARYEITSPTGALGAITDREVADADPTMTTQPKVLKAPSATALSVSSEDGALLWADGQGRVHRRSYEDETPDDAEGSRTNWGADAVLTSVPAGARVVESPNAWFLLSWTAGAPGVAVLGPDGRELRRVAAGATFVSPPAISPTARALVGAVDDGGPALVVVGTDDVLLATRLRSSAGATRDLDVLGTKGIAVWDTDRDQLHTLYEEIEYCWDGGCEDGAGPVFASLDGMLEVLRSGFQAVFLENERTRSMPALRAFAERLKAHGEAHQNTRLARMGAVAIQILDGDYSDPEAALIKAETFARSEVHGRDVDFQDFHPRGPYASDPRLTLYFHAFKYVNLLDPQPGEIDGMLGDPALVQAFEAWYKTEASFLPGSRRKALLMPDLALAAHVRADCLPDRVQKAPYLLFPLAWGADSEILLNSVDQQGVAADCAVPGRDVGSGLDLLAGLGGRPAKRMLAGDLNRYPDLANVQSSLQGRFGALDTSVLVHDWLRLVQILGDDERVPEGVSPEVWQARLAETALGSWVGLRHTMVLVNEGSAAEAGEGAEPMFEELSTEPARGAVDPVPEAWAQLGHLLERLSALTPEDNEASKTVKSTLAEAAVTAKDFGDMARRQMAGVALTLPEYRRIAEYHGAFEHPYLLLTAAASPSEGLVEPEPLARIVDIRMVPDDPEAVDHQFWHVALGPPRRIRVLIGDRGALVPAEGGVYSYYEVLAGERLDDEAWRKQMGDAARPPWVTPSQPAPRR